MPNQPTPSIDIGIKTLIPPLSAEEYGQLEANILAEGCREALIVWSEPNILIDGHNRFEICTRHGLAYRIDHRHFDDANAAKLWIIDNQLGRRNLSDFARGELALNKKSIFVEIARINQLAGLKQGTEAPVSENSPKRAIDTREEIAELAGVSSNTISKIEHIKEKATPDLLELTREGEVSINAAAHIANLPEDKQNEIVNEIRVNCTRPPEAIRKAAGTAREPGGGQRTINENDLYEIMMIKIQSCANYFGFMPPVSTDMAHAIVTEIRKHLSGTTAYFSRATQVERKHRNILIKQEFDGKDSEKICRKYGVSKRTVYRALSGSSALVDSDAAAD